MEQRPIPYTSTNDDYAYAANPHDWHNVFLAILKWVAIIAGLGLSGYFLFGIINI